MDKKILKSVKEQADPVFEVVDTTVQKSCEGCKNHTGDYMSCDYYDRKPGCVLYDEKCPSYETWHNYMKNAGLVV